MYCISYCSGSKRNAWEVSSIFCKICLTRSAVDSFMNRASLSLIIWLRREKSESGLLINKSQSDVT